MTGPQPNAVRFRLDPRDVLPVKAARLLGMTLGEFEATLPRLRRRGFPPPDPDTGRYDLKAVGGMDGPPLAVDGRRGIARRCPGASEQDRQDARWVE